MVRSEAHTVLTAVWSNRSQPYLNAMSVARLSTCTPTQEKKSKEKDPSAIRHLSQSDCQRQDKRARKRAFFVSSLVIYPSYCILSLITDADVRKQCVVRSRGKRYVMNLFFMEYQTCCCRGFGSHSEMSQID